MWARPESRMASVTSFEIPPRSPVMRAAAISAVSPGNAALTRTFTASLNASTRAQAARSHGGAGAPSSEAILLVA